MITIKPTFFDQFHCIADQCTDTCCAGWAVMIDEETAETYLADPTPLGEEIRQQMEQTNEGYQFKMTQERRCPFLQKDNLCSLILRKNQDILCEICANHPRFYFWYGDYAQSGIGLCCEVGSQLLLTQTAPLAFVEEENDEPGEDDYVADILYALQSSFQNAVFSSENPTNIRKYLENTAKEVQESISTEPVIPWDTAWENTCPIPAWQRILKVQKAMIAIDENWTNYLENLEKNLEILAENQDKYWNSPDFSKLQYQNILAYLLYRHLPGAIYDGDVAPRVQFALESLEFLHLSFLHHWVTHGQLPLSAKVFHLKNWSKQVEYCQENLELYFQ